MDPLNSDLVDISEQLQFQNPFIQSQGLCQLLDKLKCTKESNEKKHNAVLKLFFDCSFSYGDCVQIWFTELLPSVIENGWLTESQVFNEVLPRLNRVNRPDDLFYCLVEVCKPSISDFLKILKKFDDKAIIRIFTNYEFAEKHVKYLRALIFSSTINETTRTKILNNSDVQKLLNQTSKQAPKLDVFHKLQRMRSDQKLIFDEEFKSHTAYLPHLISFMQARQLLWKQVDESKMAEEMKKIRQLIADCHILPAPSKIDISTDSNISIEDIFNEIVLEKKADTFIDFVDFYFEMMSLHRNRILLPFLTALFPFCTNISKLCDLVVKFVVENPNESNTYILYFISLFGKPFFKIERLQIIGTLTKLAINRFSVSPIVKFLCAMSQQPINEKCAIFESLGKLVQKYPTIYESILPVARNISTNDSEHVFVAKLQLIRNCCLATDGCDELLSVLSKLLKEDGAQLHHTINVVFDLVENDVLDIRTVRRQLSKKTGSNGVSQLVLAAYSRILSLGCVPDKDESEEENLEFRCDCIKELYSFTRHSDENVASQAWKSLSDYDREEIANSLNIDIPTILLRYQSMKNVEREGFVQFAHKLISKEVDSYPRPLYNVSIAQNVDVLPLYTKIDTYKDSMLMKNQNEEWFWKATLPLAAPILQLTSASNKALIAVRLIRSCATMIPPSNSPEDMVRLMASWRICIREALKSLSESKNNDVIWARDQICEEGRRALAERSESVDNVMMILTVLVDIMEEKLKTLEDKKQIGEIVNSQKPWLISVFEFCATRLPKEVKSKRETKANPIYQIMTQSNKSSLHIAIFCIRLLYRNSTICEFYGDGKELGLIKDNLFTCFVEDLTTILNEDEMPSRKMLWIDAEAYGVDILTIRAFEKRNREKIDEKSENVESIASLVEDLGSAESIEQFFEKLCYSDGNIQIEYQTKSRKIIEKIWNNGTDEVKKAIYSGLGELMLCSANGHKKAAKMVAGEKLPENSVLRNIINILDEKRGLDEHGAQLLVPCFVGHKRSDGRFLPPIDWKSILERCNWRNVQEDLRVSVIGLACEQNIEEVIFDVINSNSTIANEEVLVMANHLPSIVKILPRRISISIIKKIISNARNSIDTEKLAEVISKNQSNPVVRQVLMQELPNLENIKHLSDVILSNLKEPREFVGNISIPFDFWIETRNKNGMKMKRLCDLYSLEEDQRKRNAMLAFLSIEGANLSDEKRVEKVLDVITISRISRCSNQEMAHFLPILLALIVCQNENIDVPLNWFDTEDKTVEMLCCLRRPFVERFLSISEMEESIKHLVSFFVPYISGDECHIYENWQRNIAKDTLLSILTKYSGDVMPLLENENDDFWNTVLDC